MPRTNKKEYNEYMKNKMREYRGGQRVEPQSEPKEPLSEECQKFRDIIDEKIENPHDGFLSKHANQCEDCAEYHRFANKLKISDAETWKGGNCWSGSEEESKPKPKEPHGEQELLNDYLNSGVEPDPNFPRSKGRDVEIDENELRKNEGYSHESEKERIKRILREVDEKRSE